MLHTAQLVVHITAAVHSKVCYLAEMEVWSLSPAAALFYSITPCNIKNWSDVFFSVDTFLSQSVLTFLTNTTRKSHTMLHQLNALNVKQQELF